MFVEFVLLVLLVLLVQVVRRTVYDGLVSGMIDSFHPCQSKKFGILVRRFARCLRAVENVLHGRTVQRVAQLRLLPLPFGGRLRRRLLGCRALFGDRLVVEREPDVDRRSQRMGTSWCGLLTIDARILLIQQVDPLVEDDASHVEAVLPQPAFASRRVDPTTWGMTAVP